MLYYKTVKLETSHMLTVDDLDTSTSMHTTTLSSTSIENSNNFSNMVIFFFFLKSD